MTCTKTRKKGIDAVLALVVMTSVVSTGILFNPTTAVASPQQEIANKFQDLTRNHGFIGTPVTPVNPTPDAIGFYQHYKDNNGNFWSIYWTSKTGAHEVHGDIRVKWASFGWERGLGYPLTDELSTPDGIGRFNHFSNGGSIYWTSKTGAHEVHGDIRVKWASFGWERGLGYPLTDELSTPDGIGRFNHFSNGGSIYWTSKTGAHEVHGDIRVKWASFGWERGLGYPLSDEVTAPDGKGRYNVFGFGGVAGSVIYWSPVTGAHEVHGEIQIRYANLDWVNGPLGYPKTDELGTPDGKGRFNVFEHGNIYWTPWTGAHTVYGAIGAKYVELKWETGPLGYPKTDAAEFRGVSRSVSWPIQSIRTWIHCMDPTKRRNYVKYISRRRRTS